MTVQSYGAKATFFITGNNLGKGMINDPSTPYPDIIKVRTCLMNRRGGGTALEMGSAARRDTHHADT